MQRVMLKDKRCATCRWWEGCREIFFVSQKPHAINYEGKGNCMADKNRGDVPGIHQCPRWVKWEKLP